MERGNHSIKEEVAIYVERMNNQMISEYKDDQQWQKGIS